MGVVDQYVFDFLHTYAGRVLCVFLGAAVQQLFLDNTKYEAGITDFLKRFFPKRTKVWYYRANTFLFTFIGTLLVMIMLTPDGVRACFFAGITWCATLKAIGIQIPEKSEEYHE